VYYICTKKWGLFSSDFQWGTQKEESRGKMGSCGKDQMQGHSNFNGKKTSGFSE
jgi:hypothetical protein